MIMSTLPGISRRALYNRLNIHGSVIPPALNGKWENVTLEDSRNNPLDCPPVTVVVHASLSYVPPASESVEERMQRERFDRRDFRQRIEIVCPNCSDPIPFGRFHQHYETASCHRRKKTNAASMELGTVSLTRVGKVPGGYAVCTIFRDGFTWQAYRYNGSLSKLRFYGQFSQWERFSMLVTQPAAFGDLIGEQDVPGIPEKLTRSEYITAVVMWAGSCYDIPTDDSTGFLLEAEAHMKESRPDDETAEEKRIRQKANRLETRLRREEFARYFSERFPLLSVLG